MYHTPFDLLRNISRASALNYAYNRGNNTTASGFYPAINSYKDGDDYVVVAELAGVSKDALELDVSAKRIKISGEKAVQHPSTAKLLKQERNAGTFERNIELPQGVDVAAVKADFSNGLLTITLPLHGAKKPRQINIQ